MKITGSSGSADGKRVAAAVGLEPATQVRPALISCTASYWISFSSTSAEVRQSIRLQDEGIRG